MTFADYHERLRSIPHIEVPSLFSTDYTMSLFSLYSVVRTYTDRTGHKQETIPTPTDIQFKKSKTKASMRCTFKSLDLAQLNNVIIDLSLISFISIVINDDSKTIIDVVKPLSQPVELGVPEMD